jgi:hypothetical protein
METTIKKSNREPGISEIGNQEVGKFQLKIKAVPPAVKQLSIDNTRLCFLRLGGALCFFIRIHH